MAGSLLLNAPNIYRLVRPALKPRALSSASKGKREQIIISKLLNSFFALFVIYNVMSMTPIKVRGKKSSLQRQSSKHSLGSLLNPYLGDKRPISPTSHSSTPPAKSPRHTNTRSEDAGGHARFAAPLEQLPTELLEAIFLYDLNLSLPQASPIIGSKLASKHVKTQVLFRVCSAATLRTYPSEQATLFPAMIDHAEAQSAILRMRWMTLTFLRQLIPDYITKTIVRELSERRLQWLGKGPLVTKETEPIIRHYLEDHLLDLTRRNQDDLPVVSYVSWRIEKPSRIIRLSFSLRDGIVTIEERCIHGCENSVQHVRLLSADRHQWRIFCGINGCKVPGKLLHGPWTTDKCDFLEMVIRGNATVDWVGTTSGEIAEEGLIQALREGNIRATRLLVTGAGSGCPHGLWGFPYNTNSIGCQKIEPGPWPREGVFKADAFDVIGAGVVPQTRHLRTAVFEAGCRRDIVEMLLKTENTNIDLEDRAILDWIAEKKVQGDKRGGWLLTKLSSCRPSCYR